MLEITFVDPVNIRYMGGGEVWLLTVASSLSKRGYDIRIISFRSNCEVRQKMVKIPESVEYIEYSSVRLPRGNPMPSPSEMPKFLRKLNASNIIYFYAYPPNELYLCLFKHKIIRPIIAGFHTFLELKRYLLHALYYPIFIRGLKVFNAYHVLNKCLRNTLFYHGFKNVYFIPNGVDTNKFGLCHSPETSETFNILFTGRLIEEKGVDILVKIIQYVNRKLKIPNIKFIITGSGPLEYLIKRIARQYENVHYLGFVSRKIIPDIYRSAHLFLIPSRMEGMPLRLLEAQSCGLPAIGSRIPGISDIVIHKKTGYLADVKDISSFAKAIKVYYELWRVSPTEYYKLNQAIREHIVKNYDWSIIIDKLEGMFRDLVTDIK